MVEVKYQYPFIDTDGSSHYDLIKHWAEDSDGERYIIRQMETGDEYSEAIDIYPNLYTYVATDKPVKPEPDETIEDN